MLTTVLIWIHRIRMNYRAGEQVIADGLAKRYLGAP